MSEPARSRGPARATAMLVVVTLLWGLSFPLMKSWQEAAKGCPGGAGLGGVTLIALRSFLAVAVLAVIVPRSFRAPTWREHGIGLLLGFINCIGFWLQVIGLGHTSPASSAFLTSLSSVWIPVLAFVCLRMTIPWPTLLGLAVGLVGAAVLGIDTSQGIRLGVGEAQTIVATVFFAVVILLLDRFGKTVESSHLTFGFILATGVPSVLLASGLAAGGPGLGAWSDWTASMLSVPAVLRDFVLLTVFSTVLAVSWMNTYQPRVPAGRVALIYLLEPVFAAMFSLAFGHEEPLGRLLAGGGLILGGNLLVELPALLRSRQRVRVEPRSDP